MLRQWNTNSNHLAIDIQGDIYYALSGGTNGSGWAYLLRRDLSTTVSYTHLTLPTILLV